MYILGGEYDWASMPVMARQLAESVEGATYRDMPDLGHFRMSEHPELFLRYIRPVLDEIADRRDGT